MPSRRRAVRSARRRVAPPVVLSAVAGFVTVVIASGTGTGVAATAASRPARPVEAAASGSAQVLASSVDSAALRSALHALDPAGRASRSDTRTPLLPARRASSRRHRWVRPNLGPLSSPFGMRWGRLHAGIDLAGPYGSPIVAATDGCITYAGPMSGYGEVMQIRDWDGTETVYGHMSAFAKHAGCVHAGETIAYVGMAGDATGPHLHFEVRVGGVPIDPIPFLRKRGVTI